MQKKITTTIFGSAPHAETVFWVFRGYTCYVEKYFKVKKEERASCRGTKAGKHGPCLGLYKEATVARNYFALRKEQVVVVGEDENADFHVEIIPFLQRDILSLWAHYKVFGMQFGPFT